MTCNNLCVIPARGGSKRIPRKNIRDFSGKPMIAWSIAAAQESGLFEHIIVSTDDDEVAAIAESLGAEVPFRRPAALADDHTATRPVIIHAIREAERDFGHPDHVCVIYPTAPFIQVADIQRGLARLIAAHADFAFSATSFAYPIQRALRLTPTGGVAMIQPEHCQTRSQDLEPAFHDAGQFYWGRTEVFLEDRATFSDGSVPIILPNWRVVDVDNEEDWQRAELLFRALKTQPNP
ncbi:MULTISPECIES: pseudaminic acid cytidylyltransferase [unclassified Thiocapsa]|uniref:pseudaminic acid cytidylyltransferase n=1 Tax=unclassified Thiocapsa TaxID=2641286 RepID=UPI0035B1BDA9